MQSNLSGALALTKYSEPINYIDILKENAQCQRNIVNSRTNLNLVLHS